MARHRRLGQHFLHDRSVLAHAVSALELQTTDRVLEIGAGPGILTRELARVAGQVLAVELDGRLVDGLRDQFEQQDNVTILHADALDIDPCTVFSFGAHREPVANYKLAGNIPYYITGALLRRYLTTPCKPVLAVLMVQLEVALRMVAGPGKMNLLAVSTQLFTVPSIVMRVPSRAFRPRPKVESAIVKLDVLEGERVSIPGRPVFFEIVRAGFSSRRKQLLNSLSNGLKMEKADVRGLLDQAHVACTQRAEDLSLEEWSAITWAFNGRTTGTTR